MRLLHPAVAFRALASLRLGRHFRHSQRRRVETAWFGGVDPRLQKPSSVAGFDIELVILASTMTIVAQHPG